MTQATAPTTYRTDKLGFPVENCPKCGGTGNLPHFSHRWNGVCLRCNGAGFLYPRTVKRYSAPVLAAIQLAKIASATTMAPGDIVRPARTKEPWRTVASVKRTAHIVAESGTPGAQQFHFEHLVRFTDGSFVRDWSYVWNRQVDASKIGLAEAVEKAKAAYERSLARRK